jgi:DNA topoisomerase-2
MDDDSAMDSVFDEGESSDFAPVKPVKATKTKAAAPKKAAGPAKPRGRPAKDPSAPPKPRAKPKAAPKKKKVVSEDENSDVDMDEDPLDDESLLADTPPKQKKAPGPKKTSGKPLADIANESFGLDGTDEPVAKPSKAAGGASGKYQMVGRSWGNTQSSTDYCIAHALGTHHETPRHLHWLRRTNDRQDVGL